MIKSFFGTDGVRGQVGQYPICPDIILKLGWAAGKVLAQKNNHTVIIGKDTRISGYIFESALESGFASAGVDVILTGPMPTPAIAYLTSTFRAQAGVVISASHNPYYDNGIKFFSQGGYKLSTHIEQQIEQLINEPMTVAAPDKIGKVTRLNDASGRYIEYCKASTSPSLNLSNLNIVLDNAHGATYQVGPSVFKELGANVHSMNIRPNGFNINKNSGSTHPENLAKKVLEKNADLGIAFDGDGDRVIMVDHEGNIIDGDELIYLIACDKKQHNELHGGVVGTLMSNLGIEKSLNHQGIEFARSQVGDRYVNELLIQKGWFLGGEPSGHIICRDLTTTGDAIISALQVLKAMQRSGKTLAQLCSTIYKYPQKLINLTVNPTKKDQLDNNTTIHDAVKNIEKTLANTGRVLLRKSGTEPIIRVMVEGEDKKLVEKLAEQLATVVQNTLA